MITFLPMFWFNSYLGANVDSYKSLNFVGVMNAFAFMVLVWVVIFTWEHGEEEESMGRVIAGIVAKGAGDVGGNDESVLTTDAGAGQADLIDEF